MAHEDYPSHRPRRARWRRILWIFLGAVFVMWIGKSLLPELADLGKEQIGVVRIEGPILEAQPTVGELQAFADDPRVKAIVIRIDSPGGGVAPSQEIYNAVKRVRDESQKVIVASLGTVAASGGYYIAVASDRILANPGSLTGSIGVILQTANVEELLKKLGIQSLVIKSGRYKDIGSPFRPMNPEDRRILQSVMDDVHRQFMEAVAKGRSLDLADVEPLADGRVFTGRQAKDFLLIDDLGDLQDAIRLAGDLGGIRGEPRVVEPPKKFSFRDLILENLFGRVPSVMVQKPWMPLLYLMAW